MTVVEASDAAVDGGQEPIDCGDTSALGMFQSQTRPCAAGLSSLLCATAMS
jgi:hypothetical protein